MNCKKCIRFTSHGKPCVIDKMTEEPVMYPSSDEKSCYLYHERDDLKEIGLYEDIENDVNKIKNNIDNYDADEYRDVNSKVADEMINSRKPTDIGINKLRKWFNKTNKNMKTAIDKKLNHEPTEYFNTGDIVLFCWKAGYARWKKGRIVGNNFAMCNLPDFFGKPEYYITEIDENDEVIENQKSCAVEKDSKYIVRFEPGMEWCIGCRSDERPRVRDFKKELEEEINEQKRHMRPFDMVLVRHDYTWYADFFMYYLDSEKTMIKTVCGRTVFDVDDWTPYRTDDDDARYRELMDVDDDFVQTVERTADIDDTMPGEWCEFPSDYAMGDCPPPEYPADCPQTVYEKDPNYDHWTSTDVDMNEIRIDFEKTADEYVEQMTRANHVQYKDMLKLLTYDDYMDCPAFKELKKEDDDWKLTIERKIDDVNKKLDALLLRRIEYPSYPPFDPLAPGTLQNPWYGPDPNMWKWDPERWKIYCENNKKQKEYDVHTWNDTTYIPNHTDTGMNEKNNRHGYVYTSDITPGDPDYIMRCSCTTTVTDGNVTVTDKNVNARYETPTMKTSTMFGNEILDDSKLDTYGLRAASIKVNEDNQNKK